jgi:hypothetical protein
LVLIDQRLLAERWQSGFECEAQPFEVERDGRGYRHCGDAGAGELLKVATGMNRVSEPLGEVERVLPRAFR